MARVREILLPWDSQPQEAVDVDQNSPFFQGLEEVYLPDGSGGFSQIFTSNPAWLGLIRVGGSIDSIGAAGRAVETTSTSDYFNFQGSGPDISMTTGGTFLVVLQKTDATNRASSLFGGAFGTTTILNIHGPYSDGVTYWDFGGNTGNNRVSVGGLNYSKPTALVFSAGAGGTRIVQDGIVRASKTSAISRIKNGSNPTTLNRAGIPAGDLDKFYLIAWWSKELTDAECAAVSAKPWPLFAPKSIWVPVSAGGGTPTLTVPDTSHAHTLDNVVLTSSTALVVQDMAHGHALDALTLSTGTTLTVADAQHAHALDNVTLSTTGATSLTVADSLHAHALDAVVLTSQTDLAAADMAHGHALDNTVLTLGGINLVIAEIMHAHGMDGAALTLDTYLAVADLLHAHTIDNVLVSIPGDTLDLILKILVNRQELNPATGTFTLYDNDGTTVLYTTSAWADAAGTVPYSGGALRRIDALF